MTFDEALENAEAELRAKAGGGRGASVDVGIRLGVDIAMLALKKIAEVEPQYVGREGVILDTVCGYKPKVVVL